MKLFHECPRSAMQDPKPTHKEPCYVSNVNLELGDSVPSPNVEGLASTVAGPATLARVKPMFRATGTVSNEVKRL